MLTETVRKLALIGIAQRIEALTRELTDLRATARQLETVPQDNGGKPAIATRVHWTQRPENARKVARMHRKASATRKAASHAS